MTSTGAVFLTVLSSYFCFLANCEVCNRRNSALSSPFSSLLFEMPFSLSGFSP